MIKTLLLFGATGDLAQRYLFLSLSHLLRDSLLPADFRIVAVARQPLSSESFRERLAEAMSKKMRVDATAPGMAAMLARVEYVAVDVSQPAEVATKLAYLASAPSVSFLATPPSLFVPIAEGLKQGGLLEAPSRLVLEKPIGRDLASARKINRTINALIEESRVYRIDHYLGKAPVQNLMALRFGNTLLEAVWNRQWIESVDILVAETNGVDGREGYYAKYGALRDMVQNHILQLLCLIAMEPPASLDANAVRDEKLKVLRALRPMRPDAVDKNAVRGQYRDGVVAGASVQGFQQPADAPPTETYVALRAHIDNWRWADVPFRIATGKRLAARTTEVIVTFRKVTHWLFEKPAAKDAAPNRMVIRLQPEENISLSFLSSLAGQEWGALQLKPLDLELSSPLGLNRRIAYERLLLDALHGNPALFVRNDEIEAAWAWVDSVVAAWQDAPLHGYPAGTWGPQVTGDAADLVLVPQVPSP
jgi:glucose-6-phosphate 1-dehydrogenase